MSFTGGSLKKRGQRSGADWVYLNKQKANNNKNAVILKAAVLRAVINISYHSHIICALQKFVYVSVFSRKSGLDNFCFCSSLFYEFRK